MEWLAGGPRWHQLQLNGHAWESRRFLGHGAGYCGRCSSPDKAALRDNPLPGNSGAGNTVSYDVAGGHTQLRSQPDDQLSLDTVRVALPAVLGALVELDSQGDRCLKPAGYLAESTGNCWHLSNPVQLSLFPAGASLVGRLVLASVLGSPHGGAGPVGSPVRPLCHIR